ncbi:hypothetical protein Hanom_Chr15g01373011 [Helianthus anomalus]
MVAVAAGSGSVVVVVAVVVVVVIVVVKCHFNPCGLGHFVSLVQRFHFSSVGP